MLDPLALRDELQRVGRHDDAAHHRGVQSGRARRAGRAPRRAQHAVRRRGGRRRRGASRARALRAGEPRQRVRAVRGVGDRADASGRPSVAPDATTIPVGRPIANTRVYVLDRRGAARAGRRRRASCTSAATAPRIGYLNRPELTAERFVANPLLPRLRRAPLQDGRSRALDAERRDRVHRPRRQPGQDPRRAHRARARSRR